jgi:serine/threonine protein kinase/Tol biopolymer transport system component
MAAPGDRLDGYELLRLLGAGGMGEVWLARDVGLGRKVALKLLPQDFTHDERRVARFEQEARAASALSHPNICHVYALGQSAAGQRYIAMELVEGETLRDRLQAGHLLLPDALKIASQIAGAVSAAHAAGIIHRDLKPENVISRPDGFVKVLDFGLAKLSELADGSAPRDEATHTVLRTDAGTVVGTVAYMSPEQARGHATDSRTDIWSLGVLLYEMVSGHRPFTGQSSSDVLAAILEHEAESLTRFDPHAPPELLRIVSKALRKDREQRYQTMKDLMLDLQSLHEDVAGQARRGSDVRESGGQPTTPPRATSGPLSDEVPRSQSSAEYVVMQVGRHKILTSLVALLVAVAAVGGWWMLPNRQKADPISRSGPPVRRNLTRLTFDPGLQTDATWSPDGRFIAYASDKAGNFDIWVQPVTGGNAVQVTKSAAQDTEPDWSPDGSTIVFRSERDGGGLFVVPALGGTERRLTSFGVRPQWSPDGAQILFAPSGYVGSRSTYVVSLEGSPPHVVLESFAGTLLNVLARAWHPDGRRVSILGVTKNQEFGVFTVSLAGGPPVVTRLTPFESGPETPFAFQWTRSGAALILECDLNGISNLWRLTVDPQTLEAGSLERVTMGSGNDKRVALSRDGKNAAFTSQVESHRLWLFPFDAAGGRFTGDGRAVTAATTLVVSAALAPDGHRIAYPLQGIGAPTWELWIEDVLTGDKRQLARDSIFRGVLSWSPDGSRLAYVWNRRTATANELTIGVRPVTGGDEQLLSDPLKVNVIPYGWSPDGQSVLVSSSVSTGKTSDHPAIALWPLAAAPHSDRAERVLTSSPDHSLWQESFSPNGRWIVFEAVDERTLDTTATLYVIPATGAQATQWSRLTDAQGWADKPRWSPDGKLLYFWLRQGSLYNVWALHFDDTQGIAVGAPFQITHFDGRSRQIDVENLAGSDQSVSRTGLLLPMTDVTGNIWMLDKVDE